MPILPSLPARTLLLALPLTLIVGALGGYLGSNRSPAIHPEIKARSFQLVDEAGNLQAILASDGQGTTFRILSSRADSYASIFVSGSGDIQAITFHRAGRVPMSLTSDNGEQSTLTLGDRNQEGRLVLGAHPSDIQSQEGPWGLSLRGKRTTVPLVELFTQDRAGKEEAGAVTTRTNNWHAAVLTPSVPKSTGH